MKKNFNLRSLPSKLFLVLFTLSLFTNSCKKDRTGFPDNIKRGKEMISASKINSWLRDNRINEFLRLDWSKARQATIGGVNVVRVPTISPSSKSPSTKFGTNSKTLSTVNPLGNSKISNGIQSSLTSNYFPDHPPELYIAEVDHKLHGRLLNFIPKDKNKEFGQDGIWTGSLVEWNLTGDTVFVQEVEKSVMKDQYGLKNPSSPSINNMLSNSKLNSLTPQSDRLSKRFWEWLGDVLADFIGWVGSLFGLSEHEVYGNGDFREESQWRLRLHLECLFGCDGGGGGGGGGGQGNYVGFSYAVYDTYAPGYSGPGGPSDFSGTTTLWTTFSNSSSNVSNLINTLGIIDIDKIAFLQNNPDVMDGLQEYINNQGALVPTSAINFANWAIEYQMEYPGLETSELITLNSMSSASINLPTLLDTTGLSPYTAFKNLIVTLPQFLLSKPEILNSLTKYSGFSKAKILELMQPGKGPKVTVVNNLTNAFGQALYGHYDQITHTLEISGNLVGGLDVVQNPVRYNCIALLLAITTLHEFVHYGRDINKLTTRAYYAGSWYEAGFTFEVNSGVGLPIINRNTAIQWVNYFNYNIND